jgi:hypothetical protein
VYGQPFVEILAVRQNDRLPEIARALLVGEVGTRKKCHLHVTHQSRFCILAKLVLLRSFWSILSWPEGACLATILPLIISIDSITFRDTNRLKKADILSLEMECAGVAGSKARREVPKQLGLCQRSQ